MKASCFSVLLLSCTAGALRLGVVPQSGEALFVNNLDKTEVELGSPVGWLKPKLEQGKGWGLMHIPKTAGTSFSYDAPKYMLDGDGLFARETCLYGFKKVKGVDPNYVITMVRSPASHVYSQYLEFADHQWAHGGIEDHSLTKDVTTWLNFFVSGDTMPETDPGGYHPKNMQTRSFMCDEHDQHHYVAENLDEALANLKSMKFVGVTEYYQESTCLFHAKAQPGHTLPEWCNCENSEAWARFKPTHDPTGKVRPHSLDDLSERDLEMIAKLTDMDKILYEEALSRLFQELGELELRTGTKINCKADTKNGFKDHALKADRTM